MEGSRFPNKFKFGPLMMLIFFTFKVFGSGLSLEQT